MQLRIKLYRERYIRDHHVGVPVIEHRQPHGGRHGQDAGGGAAGQGAAERGAQRCHPQPRLQRGKRQKRIRFWTKWLARIRGEELPQNPPRVVSNGEKVLLDSHTAGDEPFMLASNLPGVPVVVDKDRVKAGLYAIRQFNSDVLLLDVRTAAMCVSNTGWTWC